MEKVITQLRATSLKVIPFQYGSPSIMGEAMELRAEGSWKDDSGQSYPASLHITLFPGHPVIPFLGDHVSITVERSQ